MNSKQLATTLAAPTGTGLLYAAYDQGSDVAVWKNSVGSGRSIISINRTQAKPTATFAGVERFDVKMALYKTISDVEYVGIVRILTSIPVAMTPTERTQLALTLGLLGQDTDVQAAITAGTMPT